MISCTCTGQIPETTVCSYCEKQEASWKCLDCKIPLCSDCQACHLKIPMLKGHKIEALAMENMTRSIDEVIFCPQHPDKVLELTCNTCNVFVCLLCALKDHPMHDTEMIDEALETTSLLLTESNINIEKNIQILEAQIKGVRKRVEETRETFATQRIELDKNLEKVSGGDNSVSLYSVYNSV